MAENKGAIVIRLDLDSDKLDAFSRWDKSDESPLLILGTNRGSASRSRFNAAHEFAHMVLHRNVSEVDFMDIALFNQIENQANRFAGAFLLPQATFLEDIHPSISLESLKLLKPKWKVSIALMVKRAEDLGVISEKHARSLWINISRRKWRQCEPLEDAVPVEQPQFLKRCFQMLADEKIVSRDEMPCRFGFSYTDLEQLANLPEGFFPPESASLGIPSRIVLRFPQSTYDGDPSDD